MYYGLFLKQFSFEIQIDLIFGLVGARLLLYSNKEFHMGVTHQRFWGYIPVWG